MVIVHLRHIYMCLSQAEWFTKMWIYETDKWGDNYSDCERNHQKELPYYSWAISNIHGASQKSVFLKLDSVLCIRSRPRCRRFRKSRFGLCLIKDGAPVPQAHASLCFLMGSVCFTAHISWPDTTVQYLCAICSPFLPTGLWAPGTTGSVCSMRNSEEQSQYLFLEHVTPRNSRPNRERRRGCAP